MSQEIKIPETPPPTYVNAIILRNDGGVVRMDFLYVAPNSGQAQMVGVPIVLTPNHVQDLVRKLEQHLQNPNPVIVPGGGLPQ